MTFPVVDAFLLCPEGGEKGNLAVCTNTLAPSMVVNEIPLKLRKDIVVLGSLVVSRDGAERMIVNCLSSPTIEYLILFGEETISFRPSTNLLSAMMHGYDKDKEGNVIIGGKGLAHQYPSISPKLLKQFCDKVKVLPLYKHDKCDEIVEEYMQWLADKIPKHVYDLVVKIRSKKKIYFDSLVELLELLSKEPKSKMEGMELDPKDFQHLQPPVINLKGGESQIESQFEITRDEDTIVCNIDINDEGYTIQGQDSWLMAYSLMKFMNDNKLEIPVDQQLLLGSELSRIEMDIKSNVVFDSFVSPKLKKTKRKQIPVESRTAMKADTKFYYRIGIKEGEVSVQSMAHDTCDSVFELRSKNLMPLIEKLAKENRFEDYEQQFLHRIDVGIETGRAALAVKSGNEFFQDFRNLFKINEDKFPLFVVEGDTFLHNHRLMITKLYSNGLTTQHPDEHKGLMRSSSILAVYRRSAQSLKHFPRIYATGANSTDAMRKAYKEQLLSKENPGAYTYGNRTRAHFGCDQLDEATKKLKEDPTSVAVMQRFDYVTDMTITETPVKNNKGEVERVRIESTHDPCLTHDIYFIADGKLHSFHTARAHNIVNAYPENIFGLHDAYDEYVSEKLGVELGDMFALSSRANMLILTEEQKAKQLIAEPSKPPEDMDSSQGPYDMAVKVPSQGVGMIQVPMQAVEKKPIHPCLETLEDYKGVNLIEKAVRYLKLKGVKHNNPIVGCYDPSTQSTGLKHRLVYFQCNKRGEKLFATAVFLNGSRDQLEKDVELCNYIATQYSEGLDIPLGDLFMFYAPVR